MTRLKEFREKYGFTQEYLARFLGVTQGAISNAERDPKQLKRDHWYKLADLFDVDPRVLEGKKKLPDL